MFIYQVDEQDVERASLEKSDIGKYGLIVQGCWQLFDTKEEAQAFINTLDLGER